MFILRGLKKIGLWCPIVFLSFVAPASAASFFDDWRFPNESDVIGDWEIYRQEGREFYTFAADFNGDHKEDEAWILIKKDNTQWGVFVFLDANGSERKIIELYRSEPGDNVPQGFGIVRTDPGHYLSACTQGYGTGCQLGERRFVVLKNPAVDFFRFESANSFFFWNEEIDGFENIWISD